MSEKTLVCIVGELRAQKHTIDSFLTRLVQPCNADLLLCVPASHLPANEYLDHAKYVRTYDASKDITTYYAEIAAELNSQTDWRKLLQIKNYWLGGIRDHSIRAYRHQLSQHIFYTKKRKLRKVFFMTIDWLFRGKGPLDQPGGAAYVFLYRHLLLKMIREEGLDKVYDRFIITRSDHYYGAFHPPLRLLDPDYVWIPEGEDWLGQCDRHWVLSSRHLDGCLNLLEPILCDSDNLYQLMKHRSDWNSESYVKLMWDLHGIKTKRYPRVQFLVRGDANTPTWTEGVYEPALNITVAYPSEYQEAAMNFTTYSKPEYWENWRHNQHICRPSALSMGPV
jgi:hypothetical protein